MSNSSSVYENRVSGSREGITPPPSHCSVVVAVRRRGGGTSVDRWGQRELLQFAVPYRLQPRTGPRPATEYAFTLVAT